MFPTIIVVVDPCQIFRVDFPVQSSLEKFDDFGQRRCFTFVVMVTARSHSYPTWNPLEARPYRRGAGVLLGSQWFRPASVTLGLVEITWFSKTMDIYRLYTSMFYVGFKETKYKSKTWLWHSAKGKFHGLVRKRADGNSVDQFLWLVISTSSCVRHPWWTQLCFFCWRSIVMGICHQWQNVHISSKSTAWVLKRICLFVCRGMTCWTLLMKAQPFLGGRICLHPMPLRSGFLLNKSSSKPSKWTLPSEIFKQTLPTRGNKRSIEQFQRLWSQFFQPLQ